jgi:hypothetical protein
MGDDITTSFGLVQRELDEAIAAAKAGGCTPEGHAAVCRAIGTEGRMIGYVHTAVRAVPGETVALLRAEVVTLVQAHAEDAVKRHVKRMLPDAPGSPTTPTEDRRRIPAGVWAVMAAMGRTAPWAVAATAMCATTGWIGWLVAKGRGWL